MRRWMVCLLAAMLLLLAGCMNHTDPGESSEPTSTQGTETTQPTETVATEPPETEVTQPEEALWAPEPWESLSYEEYFSQPWDIESSYKQVRWTGKDGRVYHLSRSSKALVVRQGEPFLTNGEIVYSLEIGKELVSSGKDWIGDGVNAYGILNSVELVQVDLRTGETDTLYTGEQIDWLHMPARDLLYFMTEEGEDYVLYRLYLPTRKLDVLTRIPTYNRMWLRFGQDWDSFFWEDTGTFEYYCINPEFYPLLRDAILDPDCVYRQAKALRNSELLWTEENAAAPDLYDYATPLFCWVLQYETGVRPLMRCTVNCLTLETETALGVFDAAYFADGSYIDYDHAITNDRFSPDAENQDPRAQGWDVLYP